MSPLRIARCRKPRRQRDERGQTELAHGWGISTCAVCKCAICEAQLWGGELSINRILYISYFLNDVRKISTVPQDAPQGDIVGNTVQFSLRMLAVTCPYLGPIPP